MINYYLFNILGIIEKIGELNDKLNAYAGEHDSVLTGVIMLGILILIAFGGINALNKK